MVRDPLNAPQTAPLSSGYHPLNISGPSIDRSRARLELDPNREIEAKYFIPSDILKRLVKGRDFAQIEQRYFPSDRVRAIVEEFRDILKIADPEVFTSARIRRVRVPNGAITFYIESKGRKEGSDGSRISRREASATIEPETYKRLKERATAGILRKRRYTVSGAISTAHGVLPIAAQVDVLQAAGRKIRNLNVKFATVDIELGHHEHIRDLRAGRHSFKFLDECVELTAKRAKEQKILATRQIAKTGLGEEQLKLLKQLEREAEKSRPKSKD